MEWHELMNKAIGCIEENLCEEIDMKKISSAARQSAIGFQRTFSIVTNMSVYEYVRRRRMTPAAFGLQNSNRQVIEISAAYKYESPEAFARAFKEIHGVSPSAARKKGMELKSFPRLTFLLSLKGAAAMDYRIETKEAFSVYGIEGIFNVKDGKNKKDIPAFRLKCRDDGSLEKLSVSANGGKVHAICDYRKVEGEGHFPYMIFVFNKNGCNNKGYTSVNVPAATWAVFKTEKHTQEQTSDAIQNLINRVYIEWLPTAGYKKIDGHELDLYYDAGDGMCYSETWIKVEPK